MRNIFNWKAALVMFGYKREKSHQINYNTIKTHLTCTEFCTAEAAGALPSTLRHTTKLKLCLKSHASKLEKCPLPEHWRQPQGKWTVSCCPRWTHYPCNESLPHVSLFYTLILGCVSHEHIKQKPCDKKRTPRRKRGEFSLTLFLLLIKDDRDFLQQDNQFAPFEHHNLCQLS